MNSSEQKIMMKRVWTGFLVLGLVLEVVLISLAVWSRVQGADAIPAWQWLVFIAIAIWIYIAFLKQRSLDISKNVVDEKIKTQRLADALKDGVIVLDESATVLLCNGRAAALSGLEEVDLLGARLTALTDATIADFLADGRMGDVEGVFPASSRRVKMTVFSLPEKEGDAQENRILYMYPAPVESAGEALAQKEGGACHVAVTVLLDALRASLDGNRELAARALLQGTAFELDREVAGDVPDEAPGTGHTWSLKQGVEKSLERFSGLMDVETDVQLSEEVPAPSNQAERLDRIVCALLGQALAASPAGGSVRIKSAPMGMQMGLVISDGGAAPAPDEQGLCFEAGSAFLKKRLPGALHGLACGYGGLRKAIERTGGTLAVERTADGEFRVLLLLPATA